MNNPAQVLIPVEDIICYLLEAEEPCTLDRICEEIRIQKGISRNDVLPVAINALATMQQSKKICAYEQYPLDDPLEYAWVLSEE